MKKRLLLNLLFSMSFSSLNVMAHQDIALKISGDNITGLPEKYGPCSIDWKNNRLSIKGNFVQFPDFFSDVLGSNKKVTENGDILLEVGVNWKLSITASWFHDKTDPRSLPDYMILSFYPENKDYHFRVLVDMEKPAVVGSTVVLTTFSKKDGDKWTNSETKILDSLVSAETELAIDGNTISIWDKYLRSKTRK